MNKVQDKNEFRENSSEEKDKSYNKEYQVISDSDSKPYKSDDLSVEIIRYGF